MKKFTFVRDLSKHLMGGNARYRPNLRKDTFSFFPGKTVRNDFECVCFLKYNSHAL